MFSIVNLGRHLGVDSEEALKQTNRKFINRFKFVEDTIRSPRRKNRKYNFGRNGNPLAKSKKFLIKRSLNHFDNITDKMDFGSLRLSAQNAIDPKFKLLHPHSINDQRLFHLT